MAHHYRKPENLWGRPICEYGVFPTTLAMQRLVLKQINSDTLRNIYEKEGIVETIKTNPETHDIFKKQSIRNRFRQIDLYEGLLGTSDSLTNAEGPYISFEYSPLHATFNNIIYKHYDKDGKVESLRMFTDDEVTKMLLADPSHPMLAMMNKTLDMLNESNEKEKGSKSEPETQQMQ